MVVNGVRFPLCVLCMLPRSTGSSHEDGLAAQNTRDEGSSFACHYQQVLQNAELH
jgi:hypothetical protein